MKTKEKTPLQKIYKWIIAIGTTFIIFSGIFLYIRNDQKRDDDIESRLLSSPKMKVDTETYITEFSGYSEVKNLDALNKLTDKYIEFTTSVDTLSNVYRFVYNVLETNKLRNKAILNLVHSMDSIMKVIAKENKQMQKDINTGKNASELNLIEIRKLKALEINSGD